MSADETIHESCWNATAPSKDPARPLRGDAGRFDVAVIGAGIVGLTAALLLRETGRSVIVLEAGRVGAQVTGRSTAKVTSQHGLIYGYLEREVGREAASAYARSNEAALAWIAERIEQRGIACDFERASAYAYATGTSERHVEQEVEAARRAGLPATLVRELPLPFAVRAAVRFENQAQFHPTKYTAALAALLVEAGGVINEDSRVVDVDAGQPCTLVTAEGQVRARDVIVATNIPILDRGGFFGRAFPYRHMCIAAPVDKAKAPDGMFIGTDEPTRSLRSAPLSDEQRLMIFIGEAFPTGHANTARKLEEIEQFAREHFGVTEARYRWGNQDYYAADRLPFVGPVLPGSRHIRVATGFSAWGITTGTAAARILADQVAGHDNEWAWLYDSRRLGVRRGARRIASKNFGVAKSWLSEHLRSPSGRDPATMAPGEAAITKIAGKPAAAYCDEHGVLHALDARCTHMGCEVHWNDAERSWDCHCHGSRFDTEGRVLHGPAVSPLKAIADT